MSIFGNNDEIPPSSPRDATRLAAETTANDLSSLFNYPSLGQLFEGTDTRALEEMRARLTRTNQDLERVARQGAKDDAERAIRATRAINVTLGLLSRLEQMRREGEAKK